MKDKTDTTRPLNKRHAVISLVVWGFLCAFSVLIWFVDAHPWLFPPYKPEVVTTVQVAGVVITIALLFIRARYEARLVAYFHCYGSLYIRSALHVLYVALPVWDVIFLMVGRPCEVYPLSMQVFQLSTSQLAKEIRKTYFCSLDDGNDEFCLLIAAPVEVNLLIRKQNIIDLFVLGEDTSLSPEDISFPVDSGWKVEWSQSGDCYAFTSQIQLSPAQDEEEVAALVIQKIQIAEEVLSAH